jgi:type VII secretion-associated serine protease mycosin
MKGIDMERHARRRGLAGAGAVTALAAACVVGGAPVASASATDQWALQYLKAQQCWSISKGSGITVAVADTGVDNMPDLSNVLISGADFAAGTTSAGNGETDGAGHGTEMSVVIAGNGSGKWGQGLAPGVKLMPVRVAYSGEGMISDSIVAGIKWATQHGAKIINLSVGAPNGPAYAPELAAVQYAQQHGVLVVAASGDNGAEGVDNPASFPGVLAVSGIDQSGQLWSGSNTGPQVALAAPGGGVQTEGPNDVYGTTDGTSAATAYVSASAALVWSKNPTWTAGQVIRDLINTADKPAGQTGRSTQYGYGIVDPLKALQAPAPTATSNPLLASTTPSHSAAPPTAPTTQASSSSGGSPVVGIVIVVVVLVLIVLLIVWWVRRRKNRSGPPPGGGGYGPPPGSGPPPGYGYGVPPQPGRYGPPQQSGGYPPPGQQGNYGPPSR